MLEKERTWGTWEERGQGQHLQCSYQRKKKVGWKVKKEMEERLGGSEGLVAREREHQKEGTVCHRGRRGGREGWCG